MKKILLLIFFFAGLFLLFPKDILALEEIDSPVNCTWDVKDKNGSNPPFYVAIIPGQNSIISYKISGLTSDRQYKLDFKCTSLVGCGSSLTKTAVNGSINGSTAFNLDQIKNDIYINVNEIGSIQNPRCALKITPADWNLSPTSTKRASCWLEIHQNGKINPDYILSSQDVILHGTITGVSGFNSHGIACTDPANPNSTTFCNANLTGEGISTSKLYGSRDFIINNKSTLKTFDVNLGRNFPKGTYSVTSKVSIQEMPIGFVKVPVSCSVDFKVGMPGGVVTRAPTPRTPYPSLAPLCNQLPGQFQVDCKNCVERQGKIWTAIGCLSPDLGSFISQQLLGFGVGIAGGIAFLYFLYGAILYLTSQGNPEKIAMAREIIMSALLGLLLIIFSVFLLRVISVDILKLPGFS